MFWKGWIKSHASGLHRPCCGPSADLQGPRRNGNTCPSRLQPSRLPRESDVRSSQQLSSTLELRGMCQRTPLDQESYHARSESPGSRANLPTQSKCLPPPAGDPKLAFRQCLQWPPASNRAQIGRMRPSRRRIGWQRSSDPNHLSCALHTQQRNASLVADPSARVVNADDH